MTVKDASALLNTSQQTVRELLKRQLVDWGVAIQRAGSSKWTYVIYDELLIRKVKGI